jgi:uncharacterized protein (TIGR00297 family)
VPVLPALTLTATLALAGWLAGALTTRGAIAAIGVGTAIAAGTGLPGCLALGAFFITSSVVSRWSPDPAAARGDSKGSRRDEWQVLANGAAAALGGLVGIIYPSLGLWIVTCSLSAAAADTWATSLGGWSRVPPRHILTGRVVPSGTSGGITLLGTVGAMLGAALVAGTSLIADGQRLLPFALTVGILGMATDSFIGAAWQGRFHCPQCDRPTERRRHGCGTGTVHEGGLVWLDNDGVNACATVLAGLAGWVGWAWLAC